MGKSRWWHPRSNPSAPSLEGWSLASGCDCETTSYWFTETTEPALLRDFHSSDYESGILFLLIATVRRSAIML